MSNIKLPEIAKYFAITLASAFLVFKGIIPGWQDSPADFNNYFVASQLVVEGESIHQFYNNDWFSNKAKNMGIKSGAKFAPFPPPTAYILIPLTPFNPLTAKRIWLIINCLLLLLIVRKTKIYLQKSVTNTIIFVCLFAVPIANCINFGQIYLLLALLTTNIVLSHSKQTKFISSAIILGLGTAIKYVPILFAVYFYKHRSKAKLWFLILGIILVVFGSIFLTDQLAYKYFVQTFSSHLNGNLSGQGKYAVGFQSLDSLLNNLFVSDSILNPNPFIDSSILKPIIKFLVVLTIGTLLFFLLKKSNYKLNPILISIGMIGSFLLLPATASYHFLLLFLPILLINKWLLSFKTLHLIFCSLIFVVFIIQFHHIPEFVFSPTFNLLMHYPRFWCLLFVFLTLTLIYSKKYTSKHG